MKKKKLLEVLIKRRGMRKIDACVLMGVSRHYFNHILNNLNSIEYVHISALSELLDLPITTIIYIVKGDDDFTKKQVDEIIDIVKPIK
jgi:hypothetical protein